MFCVFLGNFVRYCIGRNGCAPFSGVIYLLSFTSFYLLLSVFDTDFLWNNWFASPISWLAVFKVSYSVILHPSTIPSRVSNGSPETSNGSLDELRFPHSFILHLLMEPEVTFFSQSFFAFLIRPCERGLNYQLCWIWISVSCMEIICSLAICCTLVNL